MKLNLFALFALFVLFYSCEKEESSYTEVSGVVYEQGTNNTKTVANALVELQWRIPSTYGAEAFFLDSVRTDENGRFKLSADAPSENLYVFASAYRHFPGGELTMRPNVKLGRKQNLDVQITPFSWVKMNVQRKQGNDFIRINPLPGGGIASFFTSRDTSFFCRAYGNRRIEINCFRYENPDFYRPAKYFVNTVGQDTINVTIEF
tara:strand:- start:258886 stop:259500 length:615 start_codon:yes stop_codon:yes gene_type:complete